MALRLELRSGSPQRTYATAVLLREGAARDDIYAECYESIVETAQRSIEEMHGLVQKIRHRTESDARAVLVALAEQTELGAQQQRTDLSHE